ncbi:MAG TPA: signal peptidase I [Acidobacteriota bacterium]|nr:signal peptidase I [Acidobacteriota bacterium]HNB73255.1 signal peptidase I [Acidobacteriota bacterium]HNH83109.1 signal peptidase I [Acidobacteriota bacterium]HNJ39374.1 signal peptidase I [Acidobacteriota bacterium]
MFKSAFARFQTAINLNQNSGLDDVTNASSQSSLIQRKRGVVRECIEAGLMTVIGSLFIFTFVVQDVRVETGSMKNTIQVGDYLLINKFMFADGGSTGIPWLPTRTIHRGDIVIFKFPKDPNVNYVKRVVGLPGETIEIRGNRVFINGRELAEHRFTINIESDRLNRTAPLQILAELPVLDLGPDTVTSTAHYKVYYGPQPNDPNDPGTRQVVGELLDTAVYGVGSPYKIPPDHFFCLGDNRDNSEDSRQWGGVPRKNIIGAPMWILYSIRAEDHHSGSANFLIDVLSNSKWDRFGTRIR